MQSLRRLYLYAVAFVSLETVLWGAISLARAFVAGGGAGGGVDQLATALSLILVGIPVFLLHWWLVQRAALRHPGERSALLRAIFLYGVLAATLLPVTNNTLALLDRLLAMAFGTDPSLAPLGGMQTLSDNLIAIVLNALAAAYFYTVLRSDWKAVPLGNDFAEIRRTYRYVWLVYGLLMAVIGLQRVLEFVFLQLSPLTGAELTMLSSGLALLILGTPLWGFAWWLVQRSLDEAAERESLIRRGVLFAVVLASTAGVLIAAIAVIQNLLLFLFARDFFSSRGIWVDLSGPLSVTISLGIVWLYYERILRAEMAPPVAASPEQVERYAGQRRLYAYVLALFGLIGSVLGLELLLSALLDLAVGQSVKDLLSGEARRLSEQIWAGVATLLVSLPLWIVTWRPLARGAAAEGEPGEQARRSLVRRSYLYLVLFAGVMGVMFGAGALLYHLIRAILGDPQEDLLFQSLTTLKTLLVFASLLAYHGWVLRSDNRRTERALARRRAQFPVLVLAPSQEGFAESLVAALEREAPGVPVAVHPIDQGAPDETFSAAKAVILPAELLARPPEALRLWLQSFDGKRLVVPTPAGEWLWVYGGVRSMPSLARRAARHVRELADGD
jgi:hypothetical protein